MKSKLSRDKMCNPEKKTRAKLQIKFIAISPCFGKLLFYFFRKACDYIRHMTHCPFKDGGTKKKLIKKKKEENGLRECSREPINSFHPLIFLPNGHSLCKRH